MGLNKFWLVDLLAKPIPCYEYYLWPKLWISIVKKNILNFLDNSEFSNSKLISFGKIILTPITRNMENLINRLLQFAWYNITFIILFIFQGIWRSVNLKDITCWLLDYLHHYNFRLKNKKMWNCYHYILILKYETGTSYTEIKITAFKRFYNIAFYINTILMKIAKTLQFSDEYHWRLKLRWI